MDAAFYYTCFGIFAAALSYLLGYLEGRRDEAGQWARHAIRGAADPVNYHGIKLVVHTEQDFRLWFSPGPAGDAGCCCEEKPIQYRSRDQE